MICLGTFHEEMTFAIPLQNACLELQEVQILFVYYLYFNILLYGTIGGRHNGTSVSTLLFVYRK